MAAADTARLIASLELDSRKFVAGMNKATGSLGKIEGRLGAFSGFVNRNLGRALDKAASVGVNALVDGIKGGIDSLSQLEDATTAVDGALRATGQTGKVTAAQIADWANEIEAATQAAFDDKDITRNAAVLLRYGKVSAQNLRPALEVMTNLAAKTGSVDSAASKLAKSLADPTKATRVLREVGVTLSKTQQDNIAKLVKAGKLGKAQAIILREVGKATKNAAADSKGAFGDMQNQLNDTKEDAERLVAIAAMPALQKIGTKLTAALNDQRTKDALKNLGEGVGQALDKMIAFAEKVPWGQIADGLSKAAGFAGDLLNAFSHIPPEAQAFIIGLAGLNKLSGGAVTGIIGELGKGLIKGVLGMTAGVVNINAGVVNGGGGIPGVTPSGPAGGILKTAEDLAPMGLLSLGAVASVGTAIGVAAATAMKAGSDAIGGAIFGSGSSAATALSGWAEQARLNFGPFETIRSALAGEIPGKFDKMIGQLNELLGNVPKTPTFTPEQTQTAQNTFRAGERESWTEPLKAIGTKQDAARATFEGSMAAVERTTGTGLRGVDSTARSGLSGATSAVNAAAARISGAVANARPIVTTNVDVNITSTGVAKAAVTSNRYGPSDPAYSGPSSKYDKPYMAQKHYYRDIDGTLTDMSAFAPRLNWVAQSKAEEGTYGSWSVTLDDPNGELDILGHRQWFVEEDESEDEDDIIWGGFTGAQSFARMDGDQRRKYGPEARVITVELMDANSWFAKVIMRGADANRTSIETDAERMAWVLATSEAGLIVDTTTFVNTAGARNMDVTDLRGTYVGQIIADCAGTSGKNHFLWYRKVSGVRTLTIWYGRDTLSTYPSPFYITNDRADIDQAAIEDGTAVVWQLSDDAKMRRSPEKQYCGCYATYGEKGAATYRHNADTHALIASYGSGHRDMTSNFPLVKTVTSARNRADRQLLDVKNQEIRVTTTIKNVPSTRVTLAKAGMRLQVKGTHWAPDLDDWHYARIVSAQPRPHSKGDLYDIELELSVPSGSPSPGPGGDDFGGTSGGVLWQPGADFEGPGLSDDITWAGSNDAPGSGYPGPGGPFFNLDTSAFAYIGSPGNYGGYTVVATSGSLDIHLEFDFVDVAVGSARTYTARLLLNGSPVATQAVVIGPGFATYLFMIDVADLAVVAGDTLTVDMTVNVDSGTIVPSGTGATSNRFQILPTSTVVI